MFEYGRVQEQNPKPSFVLYLNNTATIKTVTVGKIEEVEDDIKTTAVSVVSGAW